MRRRARAHVCVRVGTTPYLPLTPPTLPPHTHTLTHAFIEVKVVVTLTYTLTHAFIQVMVMVVVSD